MTRTLVSLGTAAMMYFAPYSNLPIGVNVEPLVVSRASSKVIKYLNYHTNWAKPLAYDKSPNSGSQNSISAGYYPEGRSESTYRGTGDLISVWQVLKVYLSRGSAAGTAQEFAKDVGSDVPPSEGKSSYNINSLLHDQSVNGVHLVYSRGCYKSATPSHKCDKSQTSLGGYATPRGHFDGCLNWSEVSFWLKEHGFKPVISRPSGESSQAPVPPNDSIWYQRDNEYVIGELVDITVPSKCVYSISAILR